MQYQIFTKMFIIIALNTKTLCRIYQFLLSETEYIICKHIIIRA